MRVLLVLVCMLTTATSAFAECGWVVWSYALEKGVERYTIASAHPTMEECDAALHDAATVLTSKGYEIVGPAKHAVLGKRGEHEFWRFLCVPDTVDPRGPKER